MKIHELLDKPEKWYNPKKDNQVGCECISTAATRLYGFPASHEIRLKILSELKLPNGFQSLYNWNDAPERTFEEVRTLCLKLDI